MVAVTYWALAPQSWPKGQKLRIVVIADLHAGAPQMSLDRVQKIVAQANALQGDMTVILGDYLADHTFQSRRYKIEDIAIQLAQLRAPLGVFGVLGNHDWRADPAARANRQGPIHTQRALEAQGMCILVNRAIKISHADAHFWLAGLDSQSAFQEARRGKAGIGADDLAGTLAQITDDCPVILLAHEPDIFAKMHAPASITLSGHTHGGQIVFGRWRPVVPSQYGAKLAYGHHQDGARHLIVSGGLGCSGLPIRFGAPPEITVVDLG
jgi:predicted MPP superfamily phosphohydrolase